MAIELFSIGTELVLGQIQDTNAHWIAQQILQLGGELRRVTMLRDDFDEMTEALGAAIERETALILMTGGLGPTPDDMTVAVVASLIGTKPVVSEETIAEYRKRREMSENDPLSEALTKMATVPETAEVLQNPAGWAPCISVSYKESTLMMMPGPPREMKAVFETHIQPLIVERYRAEISTARVFVSMFEAEVSPLMQKVMERHPEVYLKAYVALRDVGGNMMPVDFVSTSSDKEESENQLQLAIDFFQELVLEAGKTFSYEDQS
ncbi:MAG: competence/damage-inducible protein A [Candidatus Poribacteria bacterium]|nr:competence/damage-inducible protein A [Candidatus Poribacteria bacterium]